MTEDEWLNGTDVYVLLKWLQKSRRHRPSRRKLGLFSCACARRLETPLSEHRHLVEFLNAAERLADGGLTKDQASQMNQAFRDRLQPGPDRHTVAAVAWSLWQSWETWSSPEGAARYAAGYARVELGETEPPIQCDLLRDVIGNPYRRVVFASSWRTVDVLGLARAIYDDRAFDRMPVLADALMDAGCADEQVIGHCRSASPHVRGCWVVDGVLGNG